MNKNYIAPTTKIFVVKTLPLMNASLDPDKNVQSISVSTDDYSSGVTVGSRRGGSFWDDEE